MSDFLQSLVLRAAGLPLSAAAAPRELPRPEPLESAPDEESSDVAVARDAARERAVVPLPPRVREAREESIPETTHAAPPEVIEQFNVVREETVIHEHEAAAPPVVPPRAESPAPLTRTQVVERETVVEQGAAPEQHEEAQPAQFVVAPQKPSIEVPRETVVEREMATQPAAAHEAEESRPVVLQPIVLDRTRTVVEPVREEHTVVETHTERVIEPAPRPDDVAIARAEPAPPRAIVEPRTQIAQQQTTGSDESDAPREERHDTPAATATHEPAIAQPRTLVLAPLPAPQQEREAREPQQELAIHIGTIEIRAAAPPPPPQPPQQTFIQQAPEPPSNFDDYAAVRNYAFPDPWR
ncbi:MAG TPA: hypothetical protein VF911_22210 [Thermoanaerobaculia bacterium]|jgi:hypothetical protein